MQIDFLTAEGRWFNAQQLIERNSAGFGDKVIAEKWITNKEGHAIFIAGGREDPPQVGEVAGSAMEHEHAAAAHKEAMDAMNKSGEHDRAEKHRVAMLAHQKAAAAVREANDASEEANLGHGVHADPNKTSSFATKTAASVLGITHGRETVAGRREVLHAAD